MPNQEELGCKTLWLSGDQSCYRGLQLFYTLQAGAPMMLSTQSCGESREPRGFAASARLRRSLNPHERPSMPAPVRLLLA